MAIQPASSTQMLSPTSPHGFFKTLPREIRDNIYDLLYREIYVSPLGYDDPSMTVRIPRVALRLVSRQFKLEYDERIVKNKHLASLEICDEGGFPHPTPELDSQLSLISHTTNMTLDLSACHASHEDEGFRCDSYTRIFAQGCWIDSFATLLPHLRSIRVIVNVTYEECMKEALGRLGVITANIKIDKLEVRHTGLRGSKLAPVKSSEIPALATWTEEQGLVQDEEAIKRCREGGLLRWSK